MLYAGTSGYSFRGWVGNFYPPGTKPADYLSVYAQRLNSVEINYTFRRFPEPELCRRWVEATPAGFRFSVKMHQKVTHRLRLRSTAAETVRDFLEALDPLGPRLGVVLFQCPPNFRCDVTRLADFLSLLPSGYRFAFEFRHRSWQVDEVAALLREASAATCLPSGEGLPPRLQPTAPFAYLRLREEVEPDEDPMRGAREQVEAQATQVEDIYLYAKHDERGITPESVRRLAALGEHSG